MTDSGGLAAFDAWITMCFDAEDRRAVLEHSHTALEQLQSLMRLAWPEEGAYCGGFPVKDFSLEFWDAAGPCDGAVPTLVSLHEDALQWCLEFHRQTRSKSLIMLACVAGFRDMYCRLVVAGDLLRARTLLHPAQSACDAVKVKYLSRFVHLAHQLLRTARRVLARLRGVVKVLALYFPVMKDSEAVLQDVPASAEEFAAQCDAAESYMSKMDGTDAAYTTSDNDASLSPFEAKDAGGAVDDNNNDDEVKQLQHALEESLRGAAKGKAAQQERAESESEIDIGF